MDHEKRRQQINASELPAICGKDNFGRTPQDVWAEKVHSVIPNNSSTMAEWGNLWEKKGIPMLIRQRGCKVRRQVNRVMTTPAGTPIAATPDAMILNLSPRELAECKLTGRVDRWIDRDPDVPNDVPEHEIIQTHTQMLVFGAAVVWMPVALIIEPRVKEQMFRVERDDDLIQSIRERADWFWGYVQRREPIPGEVPSLDVLKRIRREPNKTVPVKGDTLLGLMAAKERTKAAKADEKDWTELLVSELDNAEKGVCEEGSVTYYEIHRKAYPVAAGSCRRLYIKGAKK